MKGVLLGIVIGAVLGGGLVFYLLGVPSSANAPGSPIQPPDPTGVPAGTAQIVLRQDFFNEVLNTIFRDMHDPAFRLGSAASSENNADVMRSGLQQNAEACDGRITFLPEGSGVRTALLFEGNKIAAPLAFSGNYNSPFGCLRFTGWAKANMELRFDSSQQAVFGQINVETVNLDGVNPVLGGFVTPIVQSSINSRVNPIQVLQGKQIALSVPIAATQGTLNANVSDVRAEVKDSALNLYVTYDFSGAPAQ